MDQPAHMAPLDVTAPSPRSRAIWMDTLRGYAIVLVILYHATLPTQTYLPQTSDVTNVLTDGLGPFRMAALMFLSGMLLTRSMSKGTGTYVRGKLARVGWPYLVWTAIMLGAMLSSRVLAGEPLDPGSALRVIAAQEVYTWFLLYVLAYYLLALLLRRIPRAVLIGVGIAVSLVPQPIATQRFAFLFAFFLLGSLITDQHPTVLRFRTWPGWLRVAAVLAASAGLVAATYRESLKYSGAMSVAIFAGVMLLAGLAQATAASRVGKGFAGIGRDSLAYYVVHNIAIIFAGQMLVRVTDTPAVMLPLLVVVGAVSGWFAVRLARRFSLAAMLFDWPPNVFSDRRGLGG